MSEKPQIPLDPVRWDGEGVRIIDQRFLPGEVRYRTLRRVDEVAEAILTLAVRGAPAIGIAAAYGVLLGARRAREAGADPRPGAASASERLRRTRPTAVNLFWALDRMNRAIEAAPAGTGPEAFEELLRAEANTILAEDLETGRKIAEAGLALLPGDRPARVMTHCNAGGLATGGWGTALAPLYAAHVEGRDLTVLADETRPLLQGSRLTAWEMARVGIPVKVLVDGASASVLRRDPVDLVIVGADRVAANGDTANKIGTYPLALAAREAKVPFYVAAPLSTFDFSLATGDDIPVEERAGEEVLGERPVPGVEGMNPAFDVTPAGLIAGWITEIGVIRPPFEEARVEAGKQNG